MTTLKKKMDEWFRLKFQLCETPHGSDFVQIMQALKEAIQFIKSQSRSEFDSGPEYVLVGAELLKKWGF